MKTKYTPSKLYTIINDKGDVQGRLSRLQDATLLADTFALAMNTKMIVIRTTDYKVAYTSNNW